MKKSIKNTCCFIGSRPQNLSYQFQEQHPSCVLLKELLKKEIELIITEKGITHFITGMALGVDQWAAEIVLEMKKSYPFATLESAIPYEEQAAKWTTDQRERYYAIARQCDTETMMQGVYTKDCMQKRNRYMVDSSQIVIAVWNGRPGNAGSTVKYAKAYNREIVYINPETLQVEKE